MSSKVESTEIKKKLFYDHKPGHTGIDDLARRNGLPSEKPEGLLTRRNAYFQ